LVVVVVVVVVVVIVIRAPNFIFISTLSVHKLNNSNNKFIMGCGTKWTNDERSIVCYAYVNATNDPINGKDQSADVFWKKVHINVKSLQPAGCEEGTYSSRGHEAIKAFLSNSIFRDVQKFNTSLRMIRVSKPTGCNESEIISMAVAFHLNRTSTRDYNFKSFDPHNWSNYSSWMTLKVMPKFREVPIDNINVHYVIDNDHASAITPTASHPNNNTMSVINLEAIETNMDGTESDLKMPAVVIPSSTISLSGQRKAKRERALDIIREKSKLV
jgi:hypothetical protein